MRNSVIRKFVISILFMASLCVLAGFQSTASELIEKNGLRYFSSRLAGGVVDINDVDLAKLRIAEIGGDGVYALAPIEGMFYTLKLKYHSTRAKNFKFLTQEEDGSFKKRNPGPVKTLRGMIVEDEGSRVTGSLRENGLEAVVEMSNGSHYIIEPRRRYEGNAKKGEYFIYNGDIVKRSDMVCQFNDQKTVQQNSGSGKVYKEGKSPLDFRIKDNGHRAKNVASQTKGPWIATLACDSDFEYFVKFGNESSVLSQIEADVNMLNTWYERDADISHEVAAIIVRKSKDNDPYEGVDINSHLDMVVSEWASDQTLIKIPNDLIHLWSGAGNSIQGVAMTGFICDGSLAAAVMMNPCATGVAHEIGHVWGLKHCDCPGWIMNPIGHCDENAFHPTSSIPILKRSVKRHKLCLENGGSNEPDNPKRPRGSSAELLLKYMPDPVSPMQEPIPQRAIPGMWAFVVSLNEIAGVGVDISGFEVLDEKDGDLFFVGDSGDFASIYRLCGIKRGGRIKANGIACGIVNVFLPSGRKIKHTFFGVDENGHQVEVSKSLRLLD